MSIKRSRIYFPEYLAVVRLAVDENSFLCKLCFSDHACAFYAMLVRERCLRDFEL